MNPSDLRILLNRVRKKAVPVEEALKQLRHMPYEQLGFATIDHHRALRQGQGEVILCEGKRPDQILAIIRRMTAVGSPVLATRATASVFRAVKKIEQRAVYHELGRVITIEPRPAGKPKRSRPKGRILIITAGTSDIPVAEESRATLEFLGSPVETVYDVGVAGLHRIMEHRSRIDSASVLIIMAGMDGALASVVGGWTDKPIVAVPTRIGYGASFGGIAALLTMLNSCAPGIAVVNIDNGFGAAVIAHRINQLGQSQR